MYDYFISLQAKSSTSSRNNIIGQKTGGKPLYPGNAAQILHFDFIARFRFIANL
jgi:hypothetical protein